MKKPIKKRPVKKKPVDTASTRAWTDHSESFSPGVTVQAKRFGGDAHLDIRLPADRPKGSVTFYVQGSVDDAIAWLIANKDRLKYAAQAG